MLISATHTHSAPSVDGRRSARRADPEYVEFLPGRIAEGIEQAARRLAPARIGWAAVDDYEHTFCRRWIYRPDKMLDGSLRRADRAGEHAPRLSESECHRGRPGPVDPGLTVLSHPVADGQPIAVLANYSMHYFGSTPVSADYYGRFADEDREDRIGGGDRAVRRDHVAGDQRRPDVDGLRPAEEATSRLDAYADGSRRYGRIGPTEQSTYHDWVPLAMAETTLVLGPPRAQTTQRLAWAREIVGRA